MSYKIGVISLGCSKNLVDSELMLTELQLAGHSFTMDPSQADLLIVNTCGFIESAKEESIAAIFDAVSMKQNGGAQKVLVTGCLSQRYQEELAKELPEVDGFIGVGEYGKISAIVNSMMEEDVRVVDFSPCALPSFQNRMLATPPHLAYVRIADGCDNFCTYCAIPQIRGRFQSRTMEDILAECKELAARGVKELVLVAQDTTKYGEDLYGAPKLAELLKLIDDCGAEWIRVLYCYPERVDRALLDAIAESKHVLHYLDIPMQHVDDDVLKRMGRRCTGSQLRALVQMLRQDYPDFTLRSTFISGFPGETLQAHEGLEAWIGEGHFDRLGVFAYSQEEGTAAARMQEQLDETVKEQRRDALMALQQEISYQKNQARIGETVTVLVEGKHEEADVYICRSAKEAPDADGLIYLQGCSDQDIGNFVQAYITDASDYDLGGEKVK